MFDAVLKKDNDPISDAEIVEFPIPEDRYKKTIRALNKIQIGSVLEQDCCVADLRSADCPALRRMIGRMVSVDELDWLGKQLESFDRYELLQFNAAAERFDISSAGEMIDLALRSREVTVISDFNDLDKVGKRHYLTVHGASNPEELDNLDGTETARLLMSEQQGHITPYGVVYDNTMKLERTYDGKHLPQSWMNENCVMELEIVPENDKDVRHHDWIQFPTDPLKAERALLRVGIPALGKVEVQFSDSRFPDEVVRALDIRIGCYYQLNELSQVCTGFQEHDFAKLGAVCHLAKPEGIESVRQLAENLDQFDFAPDVHTPEEYGQYMIQQSGRYEYDANLAEYYNYEEYGIKRILQEDGVFTDYGYVSYHGTLTLEELMQGNTAESHQQEQEAKMEGMAW